MGALQLLRTTSGLAISKRSIHRLGGTILPFQGARASQVNSSYASHSFSTTLRLRYSSPTLTTATSSDAVSKTDEIGGVINNTTNGKQDPKLKYKLNLKWYWKVVILLGEICICDFLLDKYVLGGVTWRTTLSYGVLARVALDYKLHFGRDCLLARHREEDVHHRNAQRVCTMLKWNSGLYLKAGQALAMQGGVLPEEYQRMFGEMFDDAPHEKWEDIQKVIQEEFGRSIDEVFGVGASDNHTEGDKAGVTFEQIPRASASIAQVHFAQLPDGRRVAVKVQRRQIAKQVSWDLWSLKLLTDYGAWATGLPYGDLAQFVTDRIMEETDFEHEASNAEKASRLIDSDPSLRGRVYIPKVHRDLSTKRVLTTEWVDGVQLWEKDTITAPYKPTSSPGLNSQPGLGLRLDDVMNTVIELFSKQMFTWGFVHCDPHPGNILIRRQPNGSGKAQVILLDHGLYVTLTDKMRRQYSRFWKALVTGDETLLSKVSHEWGMKNGNAWADASLMKSYKEGSNDEKVWKRTNETPEERKQRMIDEAAAYLGDTELFPQEIVFLERNTSIVQGNNRFLGSPVNRIKLIGLYAVRAVNRDGDEQATWKQAFSTRAALFALDLTFWWSQARQYLGYGGGFEEELKEAEDRQLREVKDVVAELLGVVVD
ncbi:abc1 domain-containing [Trichoderma arundinaceum]|uniref:Abc1 domain-containing n=1 Tax=Trichoderma arundinaceum TaxID=490622 RepID=A0A395NWQ5_TRIAR|nr:abc1 domain-containing [Trichoderma arundinaceum]